MIKRSFSELLKTKKDEELALRGADVLEKVENALTKDLLAVEQKIDSLNSNISSLMDEISKELGHAKSDSMLVDIEVLVSREPLDNIINVGRKKKFGKLISYVEQPPLKEPVPTWGTSFAYESAKKTSKKMLPLIVMLGNAQTERQFVEKELSNTRRRVNALRKMVLPDLRSKKKLLDEWVDEEAREELGRRNWVEKVVGT